MRFSQTVKVSASALVLASVLVAGQAFAQTAPQSGPAQQQLPDPATSDQPDAQPTEPGSPQSQSTEVGEIIVTAQRREQSLQDVPVVVTALSGQILRDTGVRDIRDLQTLTPGLTVTSTSSETSTTARIRGVGTVGDNPGLESSVGVVIDGVYRPRNGVSFNDLGELDRIEVLKGPQGTLFGRNTSAGVINILTARPRFDFGAGVEATVSNFNGVRIAGDVTGPLNEQLAGRLFMAYGERDGFYEVRTGAGPRTQRDDQNQDFYTLRGQLLFQPTSTAEFRLIADYTSRDEMCCVAVQTRTGPTAALVDALAPDEGVRNPADPFERVAYSNRNTTTRIEDYGISLQGDIEIAGVGELTSVTAFRHWDAEQGQDADFTTADILYRPDDRGTYDQTFDTYTQEFRLAGETERLNWLVGVFLGSEHLTRSDSFVYGAAYEPFFSTLALNNIISVATRPASAGGLGLTLPATAGANSTTFLSQGTAVPFGLNFPAGATANLDRYHQQSNTGALFTNNTFSLTDQFDLTIGLRYTIENKELRTINANPTIAPGCAALLSPAGQQRLAGALIARGFPAAAVGGLVPVGIGTACLPWTNPQFNGRGTSQEIEENEFSGTIKLQYHATDNIMVYGSYARGYKASGFNLDRTASSNGLATGATGVVPVTDTSFPAEFVDSYELGIKTRFYDGRVLFNVTGFHQEFTDFQLNTFIGTTFVVESIPELTSRGVDIDLILLSPIPGLTFQGGLTLAQTEYGDFTAADLSNPSRFAALSLLPGNTASFAPEVSLSASATYQREIADNLTARFTFGAKYNSEYNTGSDLLPEKIQESYTLLNGRIGIGSSDGRWALELFGNNLTDEEFYQVVFNAPFQGSAFPTNIPNYQPAFDSQTYNAFLGQPRTYGVTLRLRY